MTEKQVLRKLQRIHRQKNLLHSLEKSQKNIATITDLKAVNIELDKVSGGKRKDLAKRVEEIERKRTHWLRSYTYRVSELLETISENDHLIQLCTDEEIQAVLIDRYIENKKWETIAEEHGYSLSRIFDFRKKGIREIAIKTKKNRPKKDRSKSEF